MKSRRQQKIKEIIENNIVSTQEELTEMLILEGFAATQATVSRDIKEMSIGKVFSSNGNYKYEIANKSQEYVKGILSVESSLNIVVIKTLPGFAMVVATTIDDMEDTRILGTIAGDDNIFCVIRDVDSVGEIISNIKKMSREI